MSEADRNSIGTPLRRARLGGVLLLPLTLLAHEACGFGGEVVPNDAPNANATGTSAGSKMGNPVNAQVGTSNAATMPNGVTVAPASGFPASHPVFPQLTDQAGPVLTSPKIVTVTFEASSPAQRQLVEDFDDQLGALQWWKTVADGYCFPVGSATCIGAAVGGGHVVVSESATRSYEDTSDENASSAMRAFIQEHITNGDFPEPTAQTIYAIYPPHGAAVSLDGDAGCTSFGGYHYWIDATARAGGLVRTQYVVIPDCGNGSDITIAASHEILETATDPLPNVQTGYYMTDPGWLAVWNGGGEVADMCNTPPWITENGFSLTHAFNNKSAAAGHSPCVPAAAGVYFSAAPEKQILELGVGKSATIEVTAYSDGPRAAWSLRALDLEQQNGKTPVLSFSIGGVPNASPSVTNGAKVALTVTVLRAPASGEYAAYLLDSRSNGIENDWPASVHVIP
jgi:hypothetical protein